MAARAATVSERRNMNVAVGADGLLIRRRGVEVLLAAARAAAGAAGAEVDAAGVLARAAGPTREVNRLSGDRYFLRVGDGWIALALAGSEKERFQAWAGAHDLDGPPALLAGRLQGLGLAALPALPVPVGEAVELPAGDPGAAWLRPHRAPLAGFRVVECGMLASAPHAGAVLAELGAEVVAVSHPARTSSRWHGPDPLLLDLTRPADRVIFGALCRRADLVVDNFRARVWGNLGLDPLELGARTHLRLPAFPDGDPRAAWRAYGFQTEALFSAGCGPAEDAPSIVRAPARALLDHAVGFAGVAAVLHAGNAGGRLEVSHAAVAVGGA